MVAFSLHPMDIKAMTKASFEEVAMMKASRMQRKRF